MMTPKLVTILPWALAGLLLAALLILAGRPPALSSSEFETGALSAPDKALSTGSAATAGTSASEPIATVPLVPAVVKESAPDLGPSRSGEFEARLEERLTQGVLHLLPEELDLISVPATVTPDQMEKVVALVQKFESRAVARIHPIQKATEAERMRLEASGDYISLPHVNGSAWAEFHRRGLGSGGTNWRVGNRWSTVEIVSGKQSSEKWEQTAGELRYFDYDGPRSSPEYVKLIRTVREEYVDFVIELAMELDRAMSSH